MTIHNDLPLEMHYSVHTLMLLKCSLPWNCTEVLNVKSSFSSDPFALVHFCSEKGLNAISFKHVLSSCKTFKRF